MVTVFDFDGTLYRGDSFIDFALKSVNPLRLVAGGLIALPRIAAWKMGLINSSRAKERLWRCWFKGMTEKEYDTACRNFAHSINARLNQEVYASMLDSISTPGNSTYIISASLDWVKAWAGQHPSVTVITTHAQIADGRLTGYFDGPNCLGQRKVELLLAHETITPDNPLTLYTDSHADAPLMQLSTTTLFITGGKIKDNRDEVIRDTL